MIITTEDVKNSYSCRIYSDMSPNAGLAQSFVEIKGCKTRDVRGTASGGRENQHIFVAGGWGIDSVEIFNYRQRFWSLLKPMPGLRNGASSFIYNNHVTVTRGLSTDCTVSADSFDNMIRMNIHPVPDLSVNWCDFASKLPARMQAHSSVVYHLTLLNWYPRCLNQELVTALSYVVTVF